MTLRNKDIGQQNIIGTYTLYILYYYTYTSEQNDLQFFVRNILSWRDIKRGRERKNQLSFTNK